MGARCSGKFLAKDVWVIEEAALTDAAGLAWDDARARG